MLFTDEQPFLDAVFARYHDDGPRLIYADFLEDAGDPARAELIRHQLALARLADEDPRRGELANREVELHNGERDRLTATLDGLVAAVEFRRGVPDSVTVDSAVFLQRGEELFARLPVRRLRLLDESGLLPKLIHSPLLANLHELDLCDNELGNGGVDLLARSPHLKRLEALDLSFNGMDDAGVRALARASTLPALTELRLNDNGTITADGLAALAESPFFAGLTALDVSGNDIGEAGVRAVLASPSLARLQILSLGRNPIGDAGAAVLARSALLERMVARSGRLDLRGHPHGPIGAAGAAALAESAGLARCGTLDLSGNEIGDVGLVALGQSPHLPALRVLKLARNQITDAGVGALRDSLPLLLARLKLMDLSENRLTRYGQRLVEDAQRNSGGARAVVDFTGNVQSTAGPAPVPLGAVVPDVLREVAEANEAAELRRRVAHPRLRPGERPNPAG
jgi:uncharacterized protein (TIGR02996 family)